jgi:Tfp pilus assembly protein PilZ
MSKWDGLNRRRFPRIKFPCLVVIQSANPGGAQAFLSHTENVGIGGVCFILKQPVSLFTQIGLELDLMDMRDHIKCKGKIVWSVRRQKEASDRPLFYDIGVEFIDLRPSDKARIETVITKLVKTKKDHPYVV